MLKSVEIIEVLKIRGRKEMGREDGMNVLTTLDKKMDGTNTIHLKHMTLVLLFAIKRFNFK